MPRKKKSAVVPKLTAPKAGLRKKRRAAGAMAAPAAAPMVPSAPKVPMAGAGMASPPAFKKGGDVKKTGMALVHKGEKVLTKDQAKKMAKGKK